MLFVQEQGDMTGDSGVYETGFDNIEDLFAACVEEHGEFIGDIFIDDKDGKPVRVGWAFKRDTDNPEFDPDDPDMGLHTMHVETWVTVHSTLPVQRYNYFNFDDADRFQSLPEAGLPPQLMSRLTPTSCCSGCGKPVAGEETCHDYCIIT